MTQNRTPPRPPRGKSSRPSSSQQDRPRQDDRPKARPGAYAEGRPEGRKLTRPNARPPNVRGTERSDERKGPRSEGGYEPRQERPRPEGRPEGRPGGRPETRHEKRPEGRSENRGETRYEPRQERPRQEARPEFRQDARQDPRKERPTGAPRVSRPAGPNREPRFPQRADTRPDTRQVRRPEPQGEARPEPRPESHEDARPDARPDPRPGLRPEHRRGQSRGAAGGAPATPPGTVWLYGTHAVAAALENPQRGFRRLLLTEDSQVALAAACPQPWPLPYEIVERDKIDALLGARQGSGVVHQGIALLTDQLETPDLLDALQRPGPVLVLDQIFDPRNVGALMRTAQAFGACAIIAQDRNAPEETGALAKAASGALETIPLLRVVNIARTLLALKAENVWVVGLDGTSTTRLRGADFANRRVALVLGNEGEGMRRLTRETCDEVCALAMPGGMESLNVSAAGAVALYELTRPA